MATSPAFEDPPLSIEPVVGWRVWRLERIGGALTLRSIARSDHWPAMEAMEATCAHHRGTDVPAEHCTCGLYAVSSPENLARSGVLSRASCVVGAIAMWGTVVEHARGARSRFAYPARLRLVCGPCLAAGVGAVTPVSVGMRETLTAVCRVHQIGLNGDVRPAAEVEAELLARYGVELLPIERLSRILRKGAGRIGQPGMQISRLAMSGIFGVIKFLIGLWIAMLLIGIGLAIVGAVLGGIVRVLSGGTAAATPVVSAPPPSMSIVVSSPHVHPSPIVSDVPDRGVHPAPVAFTPFAVVCGKGSGVQIDIAPCWADGADLLGWAERGPPHGPKEDCVGRWDAYAHGRRFWICWTDFFDLSDVERWVHSPNPWSIPVHEGGAIHEHR